MTRKLLIGSSALLCGSLITVTAQGEPPPLQDQLPTLDSPIQSQNEWCSYVDDPSKGFVVDIKWDHPLIRAAGAAFGREADGTQTGAGLSRSTMSYYDHIKVYQLDGDNDWGAKKGYYDLVSNFDYDDEIARIERELAELEAKKQAGSISDGKYSAGKAKLERDRAKAEQLKAGGQAAIEAELEQIDKDVAAANYKNFVKTLLGECRDYPFMIKSKLEILASHAKVNQKGAQQVPADQAFLFDSLTGDGYARLRWLLSTVFSERERRLNPSESNWNYAWGSTGHGSNRVDHSVKPFTHAEMRYIYNEWLAGPSKPFNYDAYEAGLKKFIEEKCDPNPNGPDLGYMYDFRGHKNFKANWLECNSFIWNSRDAAQMLLAQIRKGLTPDLSYYQRPFATRYEQTKMLMGAYLFYPSRHHKHMRRASESGGGCHLYVDNVDASEPPDGIGDYRLFPDVQGSGDIGLESQALPADRVFQGEVTRDAVTGFNPSKFKSYRDWGFNSVFTVVPGQAQVWAEDAVFDASDVGNRDAKPFYPETWNGRIDRATFQLRMARLTQALDRHTNWGPTHMFSPRLYPLNKRDAVRGAYSPIVAMSYEISKSHNFAAGDYPNTHPKDQGHVKFMFIIKYPTRYYYDERSAAQGWPVNWNRSYINESSVSHDYYSERALDKFGWIPAPDIHTAAYLAEADAEDYYYPSSSSVGFTGAVNGH